MINAFTWSRKIPPITTIVATDRNNAAQGALEGLSPASDSAQGHHLRRQYMRNTLLATVAAAALVAGTIAVSAQGGGAGGAGGGTGAGGGGGGGAAPAERMDRGGG